MARSGLDKTASVMVIVVGLVVLGSHVRSWLSSPSRPDPPYKVGDRIAETAALQFGLPSFVLFTASTCRYCTESMPLYRAMLDQGARLIAASNESVEVNLTYLKEHELRIEQVIPATLNGLRFRSTPSLILVDATGVVQAVWWGRQSEQASQAILERVRR